MNNDIITIKVIDRDGQNHNLEAPTDMGMNVMEVCKSYELPVEGTCGGMAMCASCHCYVLSDNIDMERSYDEQAMLDETDNVKENSRLGCQLHLKNEMNGLVIELAPEMVADDSFTDW